MDVRHTGSGVAESPSKVGPVRGFRVQQTGRPKVGQLWLEIDLEKHVIYGYVPVHDRRRAIVMEVGNCVRQPLRRPHARHPIELAGPVRTV